MGQRDHSQGFGFMYVNLSKILEERKRVSVDSDAPVSTQNVHHANFNKDANTDPTPSAGRIAPILTQLPSTDRTAAMKQIKENLDRLQTLHHKLHAMLEELNRISDSSKRRKP